MGRPDPYAIRDDLPDGGRSGMTIRGRWTYRHSHPPAVRLQLDGVKHRVQYATGDLRVVWTICGMRAAQGVGRVGKTDDVAPTNCAECYGEKGAKTPATS